MHGQVPANQKAHTNVELKYNGLALLANYFYNVGDREKGREFLKRAFVEGHFCNVEAVLECKPKEMKIEEWKAEVITLLEGIFKQKDELFETHIHDEVSAKYLDETAITWLEKLKEDIAK